MRLREADWPLRQKSDHGTHLAVYITDPDGNDLELAWDRPIEEWPRDADGHAAMAMDAELDVDALVAEVSPLIAAASGERITSSPGSGGAAGSAVGVGVGVVSGVGVGVGLPLGGAVGVGSGRRALGGRVVARVGDARRARAARRRSALAEVDGDGLPVAPLSMPSPA